MPYIHLTIDRARQSANCMSFNTADDLSALDLALVEASDKIREALRRLDMLSNAHDLDLDLRHGLAQSRMALTCFPDLLSAVLTRHAGLFSAAEAVGEAALQVVSPDDSDDIPF